MNGDDPSPSALRWVARTVGERATIKSFSRLAGATSSILHGIEVSDAGCSHQLVLRRFVNAEWLEAEPDLTRHEAAGLMLAARAGVDTPALVAFDESGKECGVPATLMTRLDGSVELRPTDVEGWLRGLARALVHIHAVAPGDFPWVYNPYNDLTQLTPPRWSSCPELWAKALELVSGPRPRARERFIHRDYHPNNVLWRDGRVSGVVDWVNSCRGPAGIDVAWCRQNLVQLYGVAEADRFLEAYQQAAGAGFDYHPFWDLIAAIEFLPGPPGVYEGWLELGITHLDQEMTAARIDAYLASVLARL